MKSNNGNKHSVVYSTEPEDFYYVDVNVPCQGACPAYTNIPAYIRALYEKEYLTSYEINRVVNILPGTLGRICSRPCETKCRHGENELGKAVNICHIKRAAADLLEATLSPIKKAPEAIHKKIAVIGSGPAGLAASHDLAIMGADVTIYEAFEKPGGMLRYGIPEFRLPREILKTEIDRILNLGITLKTGVRVGTDLPLKDILSGYDAVILAAGCYQSRRLDVGGEELAGVHSGLEFMIDVCKGRPPQLGERVLVIGAGFTAFDCARSALRLGARDVRICLRRTEEDLVVTGDEIHETKVEGVRIESLMVSRKITGRQKVEGVQFVRSQPGAMRPDGKREISILEGSEFELAADTVINATGQTAQPLSADIPVKINENNLPLADGESLATSVAGLYVAGDYLSGPSTVIEAIGMGRRAAAKVVEDLTGSKYFEKAVRMENAGITDRKRTWDFIDRQSMPTVHPVKDRLNEASLEVETGYDPEAAAEESKRCYLCYLHYEIDISRCIYCRYCIDVAPRDCIKLVDEVLTNKDGAVTGFVETESWQEVNAVVIDNSRCIRCGECMRVCPVECIAVTRVELVERAAPVEANHG